VTQLVIPFLVAFVLSLFLVPLCRGAARRTGYVAKPRADRWHQRPTALFGGVGISVTVLACAVFFGGLQHNPVLLACGLFAFVVGLTDDFQSLKPSTKIVAQILLASILLFFDYRLELFESVTLNSLMTVAWLVGITNAFNLLDNMDGLCAGIALIAAAALLAGLLPAEPGTAAWLTARYVMILVGAVGGFLVYNFHPASIFMGDSGSLFIGLNFGALVLAASREGGGGPGVLPIVAGPALVLLVPIFDTTLVTVMRTLSGRPVSTGGRDHSSHRLVAIGLSERAAVAVLWVLAVSAGGLGVAVQNLTESWAVVGAAVFLLAMVIFAVYLARIRVYDDADDALQSRGRVTPLIVNLFYKRRAAEVVLDFCLVSIAYYAANRLRFEAPRFGANFYLFADSLPIVIASQMVALFAVGVYRAQWNDFGMMDAVYIARAVVYGTLASIVILLFTYRFESYSRAVFVIYALLLMLLLTASRASFRLITEFVQRRRQTGHRLIIYGAGNGAALTLREIRRQAPTYRMVGFIDDDPVRRRARVHGYAVLGGIEHLLEQIQNGGIDAVIISASRLDPRRLEQVKSACVNHGVVLSRLQFDLDPIVAGTMSKVGANPVDESPRSGWRRRASSRSTPER
jgi:UDP-GlcNAc:undecaprenyl-phosphate GlcNAc-1-phosphate transferase